MEGPEEVGCLKEVLWVGSMERWIEKELIEEYRDGGKQLKRVLIGLSDIFLLRICLFDYL